MSARRPNSTDNWSLHRAGGVDPGWLITFRLQRREDNLAVRAISRLYRHVELGAPGGHIEEQTVVIDLQDIGPELAEPGRDLTEHPGSVRDGQPERDDAVLALELTHHDRRQDTRIDVASAQDEADVAPFETLGFRQHRRETRRTCAFGHGLLKRQIGVDGALDVLLVHQHDLGYEVADDRQGERTDLADSDA